MSIPDYQKLMYPVLKLLGNKKEYSGFEISNIIANDLKLTEQEISLRYPNNSKKIFQDRVAWARTYLKKSGLICSPQRTTSKITKLGIKVLKDNPKNIDNNFLKQFKSFREFRKLNDDCIKKDCTKITKEISQEECIQTPHDMIYSGRDTINANLENDLLERLLDQSSSFFEEIVAKLLVNMGYGSSYDDIIQLKGKSGDEGIDGIIKQDTLGLDKVYIQAKKWDKANVSGPEVQKFVGALRQKQATKGVFITTSKFTEAARKCAKEVSDTIILVDGQSLTKLMIEYNVGVQLEETILIKKIDEDMFSEN